MNLEKGYNISPGGGGRANPNNTDTHKQCPRCGEIKSRKDDFSVDNHQHDKINHICKMCSSKEERDKYASVPKEERDAINAERRTEYAENPELQEKARILAKNYNEVHKEEVAKRQAVYRINNKEKIKKDNKKSYLENQEAAKQYAKEARKQYKELNSKLTPEEIYARTPLKMCKDCDEKVPSNLFYIDLTASHGLGKLCREHFKERCRKRKEEKNPKQSDVL